MDKSITIQNGRLGSISNEKNKVVYLCTWNDGETVQIHTKETLRDEYKDTNLFDVDKDRLVNDSMFNWCLVIPTRANEQVRSISEIFDYFEDQENFTIGHVWEQDNMRIQRIK